MNKLMIMMAVALTAGCLRAAPVVVKSPDGTVSVSFEEKGGALFYAVQRNDQPVVDESRVEVFSGAEMKIVNQTMAENDSTWEPVWGQFSEIRDHYNQLTLELKAGDIPVKLLCRVFDEGLGFRFILSDQTQGKKIGFSSEFDVVGGDTYYWGERGSVITDLSTAKRISPPFVTEKRDGTAVAFLESDLYSAAGFESMKMAVNGAGKVVGTSGTVSNGQGHFTTWRVVIWGESTAALMVNNVVLNLAAPCRIKDTSWIKPGRGLWDWRVHGYDNGDFKYDINTKSFLRYIDFCADQGIEYFTIDDFWFTSAANGKMEVSPEVDIEGVMKYAKEKGVKIMLYYDRNKGDFGDETLFEYYSELGAAGMKYGFMGNKAEFTRNAINKAAENKLLINFHDGPCPMAGVERTMPNLITREFCHGQQDSRRAFSPESFLKMAVVSSLVGPLDQSNGNFGLGSINAGERKKGPKQTNSYVSTVVSECARCLVIPTGLVTLPDAPEEYLKKADLFEFLKQMPATWDESRVLSSKTGEYISVARRTGDTWFVGTVNNETKRSLEIPLNFLNAGESYAVTLFEDTSATHGMKNAEAYAVKTKTVKQSAVIQANMAVGGGHAMILRPAQ
jgi:alpha-glucosidase